METKDYKTIFDSMQTTGVYVIREDNHEILYFNKRVEEVTPNISLGMVCHELWPSACPNCPLLHIGNKRESRTINYDHPFGNAVDIVATRIEWEGERPAVMITIMPHAETAGYTYNKILKVNLTKDSFEIIKFDQKNAPGYDSEDASLTGWFLRFVEEGNVYSGDVERFQKFTQINYLREELQKGEKMKICTYRCRIGAGYRWHTMEVVPDVDYSKDNQSVMLYVKDVHDVYREGLELEEVNLRNQEIIKSLGELNYGIYAISLDTGIMYAVRMPDDLEDVVDSEYMDWDNILKESVNKNFDPEYRERMLSMYS